MVINASSELVSLSVLTSIHPTAALALALRLALAYQVAHTDAPIQTLQMSLTVIVVANLLLGTNGGRVSHVVSTLFHTISLKWFQRGREKDSQIHGGTERP